MMIDTHVHVWALDAARYPWHPTLPSVPIPSYAATVDQFVDAMNAAGVERAVLVQPSTYGWDNSYLYDALARFPGRFVGVGLVDPFSPTAPADIERLATHCRGLRINAIGRSDSARWLNDRAHAPLWRSIEAFDVTVCFQMLPRQARSVAQLARDHRSVTYVVDSLGPDAYFTQDAFVAVEELSAEPNIRFKMVSAGQDSQLEFPFRDLWPLMRHAIRHFGVERLTTGSDYPHVLAACTYPQAIRWIDEMPFLGHAEKARVTETNALSLWWKG